MIAAEFEVQFGYKGASWTLTMRDHEVNPVLTRYREALQYLASGLVPGLIGDEQFPECEAPQLLDRPAATVEVVGTSGGTEVRLVFHADQVREALRRASIVCDMVPFETPSPAARASQGMAPPQGMASPRPALGAEISVDHPGNGGETQGFIRMKSVLTTGEVDDIKCAFYADNPRLRLPVLYAPASLVRQYMEGRYPTGSQEDLAFLDAVGVRGGEGWVVEWAESNKVSDKGNPYRDVIDIWRDEDDWKNDQGRH